MEMQYIGVKLINAKPMTRLEYNQFRGWILPEDENGDDEGFLVEYIDGGKANTAEYAGYVSWSPKDVFERAYRPVANMTFGLAIEALKAGKRVARAGWNGKGMWVSMQKHDEHSKMTLPYAYIEYPEGHPAYPLGSRVPWIASQTDMFAEDWSIVE